MRILVIVALLVFIALPGSLFAQGGGGGAAATATTTTVENQAAQGGFIGVGSSTGFVGVHDVLNRTSTRANPARATTTAARPRTAVATTPAAQRRATTAGTSQFGGAGNQTIRSTTSFDFAAPVGSGGLSMQRPLPAIETSLARIHGIQDSQISVTNSPTGTTAVLTGSVASDRERRVAQQLLLLEPGINRVENLLEVR